MRVLVTGAGGFVGGALARRLQREHGHRVVALGRQPGALTPLADQWVTHDLRLPLTRVPAVDYVVHCAALKEWRAMPAADFLALNLAMTENVAQYARRCGAAGVIFASSIDLHGEIREGCVDEGTAVRRPSPYGVSKWRCEELLMEYEEHFPVAALRLCGVVGPGAASCWAGRVLEKARRGEPIELFNAGRPFNNIVHTDDLARLLHLLMEGGFSGVHRFPLASRGPVTVARVAAEIVACTGSRSALRDCGVTDSSFTISNAYASSRFGYLPDTVLANLRKFVTENAAGSPAP